MNSWNLAELAQECLLHLSRNSLAALGRSASSPWMFCLEIGFCAGIVLGAMLRKNTQLADGHSGHRDIASTSISLSAGVDGSQGCGCRPDRTWSPIEATFGVKPAIQLRPLWKPGQGGALCPLQTSTECVFRGQRFKCVEAVVDSSAEETVALRGIFPGPTRESAMSRAGASDRTASGAAIPNLGEQDVRLSPMRSTSVTCPSSKLTSSGPWLRCQLWLRLVMRLSSTTTEGKSRTKPRARSRALNGGTYILRMWVPADAASFQRQGAR